MARLVIGTDKTKTIPALVKEVGIIPTGTLNIPTNGTYDVTNYASAEVTTPSAPEIYRVFRSNYGKLENSITTPFIPLPNTVRDIGDYCLYRAYQNTPSSVLSGTIDLSSLTTVSGGEACQYMFSGCTGITSVNLSSLRTISGANACNNMFSGCTGITSVDLSSLGTISGSSGCQYMFRNCTGLTSVSLSSIGTLSAGTTCQYMFQGCTNLVSVSFYALSMYSFGNHTNQFDNMLSGVTGCTVHFPIKIQSTIGSWASVTNGFGGTNTTVLFDIVTSLTGADSNTYTRSQKNSTSTAIAWTRRSTLYYTSGTSEPAVGDTLYSDAACTTAVTTISSIA